MILIIIVKKTRIMGQPTSRPRKSIHEIRLESHYRTMRTRSESLDLNSMSDANEPKQTSNTEIWGVSQWMEDYSVAEIWTEMLKNSFDVQMLMIVLVASNGAQTIKVDRGCLKGYDNCVKSIFIIAEKARSIFIEDTTRDMRSWQHSTVQKEPHTRFYACLPLFRTQKDVTAYLCCADAEPRTVTTSIRKRWETLTKMMSGMMQARISLNVEDGMPETSFGCVNSNFPKIFKELNKRLFFGDTGLIVFQMESRQDKWTVWSANDVWIINTKIYCGENLFDYIRHEHEHEHDKEIYMKKDFHLWAKKDGKSFNLHCVAIEIVNQNSNEKRKSLDFATPPVWECHLENVFCCITKFESETLDKDKRTSPFVDIHIRDLIGKGSFGEVYRGTWREKTVAIKILSNSGFSKETNSLPREVILGLQLKHENLVETFDHRVSYHGELWIVLEFCDGGTLASMMDAGRFYDLQADVPILDDIIHIALQVAKGMHHLHSKEILHADLSANNVLIRGNLLVKISDFGMIRSMSNPSTLTQTHGTVAYMPPELLENCHLSTATDVYSFGIILFELLRGKRAYAQMREGQIITAKMYPKDEEWHLSDMIPDILRELVASCLSRNWQERISFEEILVKLSDLQYRRMQ